MGNEITQMIAVPTAVAVGVSKGLSKGDFSQYDQDFLNSYMDQGQLVPNYPGTSVPLETPYATIPTVKWESRGTRPGGSEHTIRKEVGITKGKSYSKSIAVTLSAGIEIGVVSASASTTASASSTISITVQETQSTEDKFPFPGDSEQQWELIQAVASGQIRDKANGNKFISDYSYHMNEFRFIRVTPVATPPKIKWRTLRTLPGGQKYGSPPIPIWIGLAKGSEYKDAVRNRLKKFNQEKKEDEDYQFDYGNYREEKISIELPGTGKNLYKVQQCIAYGTVDKQVRPYTDKFDDFDYEVWTKKVRWSKEK